jgi:hypothetical protein
MSVTRFTRVPAGAKVGDGSPLTSFAMRETTGHDQLIAATTAEAAGGPDGAKSLRNIIELIRISLVEVNGAVLPKDRPYVDFDRWNSKAQSVAKVAYCSLNTTTNQEDADFLANAELLPDSAL